MGLESVYAYRSITEMNLDNVFLDKNARKIVQEMQQGTASVIQVSSRMSSLMDRLIVFDALKAPIGMHKDLNARSFVLKMLNLILHLVNVNVLMVMPSILIFVRSVLLISSFPTIIVFLVLSLP